MTATAPKRIRLSRAKGWRKPLSAVTVARPTIYGNPFPVTNGDPAPAVARYRGWLTNNLANEIANPDEWTPRPRRADIEALRGLDLACWCPLDGPCHADVLLELANQPTKGTNEMTKPTRDATLGFDDVIASTERGAMLIDHDGAVVVRIVGVDELVEIDADTAVRFLGPENARQLIHAVAESLDTEQPESA